MSSNRIIFVFSFGPDAFFRKHGMTTLPPTEATPQPPVESTGKPLEPCLILVITVAIVTLLSRLTVTSVTEDNHR